MAPDVVEALLDSWDRSNRIVINLLGLVGDEHFDLRPVAGSPSIGELFTHIHYVRLVFVDENAPEFGLPVPAVEWGIERHRPRLVAMLNESAAAVRNAVRGRLAGGREMDQHFDHPILLLQHLLWHEAYHHGQIKLTMKLHGHTIRDDAAGPASWRVWLDKQHPLSRRR